MFQFILTLIFSFSAGHVVGKNLSEKDRAPKSPKVLTSIQHEVTQNGGTERPYANEYWNNKEDGIYVDVSSGEPLFSSLDKYDSGTGWPSFTQPIDKNKIIEKREAGAGDSRTEVRNADGTSHLGHVFNDGPGVGGLRYCMNSAAMNFIPKDELKKKGYGSYLHLFEKKK